MAHLENSLFCSRPIWPYLSSSQGSPCGQLCRLQGKWDIDLQSLRHTHTHIHIHTQGTAFKTVASDVFAANSFLLIFSFDFMLGNNSPIGICQVTASSLWQGKTPFPSVSIPHFQDPASSHQVVHNLSYCSGVPKI